jgi:hypothetical protein
MMSERQPGRCDCAAHPIIATRRLAARRNSLALLRAPPCCAPLKDPTQCQRLCPPLRAPLDIPPRDYRVAMIAICTGKGRRGHEEPATAAGYTNFILNEGSAMDAARNYTQASILPAWLSLKRRRRFAEITWSGRPPPPPPPPRPSPLPLPPPTSTTGRRG